MGGEMTGAEVSDAESGCEASGLRVTSAVSLSLLFLAFLGMRRLEQR
jgi:hypothetical protein